MHGNWTSHIPAHVRPGCAYVRARIWAIWSVTSLEGHNHMCMLEAVRGLMCFCPAG